MMIEASKLCRVERAPLDILAICFWPGTVFQLDKNQELLDVGIG